MVHISDPKDNGDLRYKILYEYLYTGTQEEIGNNSTTASFHSIYSIIEGSVAKPVAAPAP
jgi:hypothetical protein